MRILVTGASGFAGRHLLGELGRTRADDIYVGYVGEEAPRLRDLDGEALHALQVDVTSSTSLRAAIAEARPDQVYHLAGQASVGESLAAPMKTWEVNATGTLRLLEALREAGMSSTRVLLTSSAEVYGPVAEGAQPIQESYTAAPLTPYGASKAAAEVIARQYSQAGLADVVTARSFNQIGPGQDERFVLPTLARQLVLIGRGSAPPVLSVGNLKVFRDFLDVRDGVRAYVDIMAHGLSGQAYNVASGVSLSIEHVVERLVDLSGVGAVVEVDPVRVRPVDIPMLIGDAKRLRAFGWEPKRTLDESLRDLLDEMESRVDENG